MQKLSLSSDSGTYLSGCGVCQWNPETALYYFDALTDEVLAGERFIGNTISADLRSKGHSAAAFAYWKEWNNECQAIQQMIVKDRERYKRQFKPQWDPRLAPFFFAAFHASISCQLGLISDIVLEVGFTFSDIGERLGIDVHQIRQFAPLWNGLKHAEGSIIGHKRMSQPRTLQEITSCAALGCNACGSRGSPLKECAGKCPADLKPRYCSKKCQKEDWPNHKSLCRPGRPPTRPVITFREETAALFRDLIDHANAGSEANEVDAMALRGERAVQVHQPDGRLPASGRIPKLLELHPPTGIKLAGSKQVARAR